MSHVRPFGLGLLGLACACAAGAVREAPAGDATAAARQYVIEHRPELEREIRIGSGEALYELSILADCQDLPELGRSLKRKQAEIFPVPPPSDPEVADRIVDVMRRESVLRCRDLETGPHRPFAAGRHRVFGTSSRNDRAGTGRW
jgi:hypothetical protein